VGKGMRYYPKLKVGEFLLEAGKLKEGDTIMIIGRNEGIHQMKLNELRVNGEVADKANKGDRITFPWETKIWADDKLYKVIPTATDA
jgi:U32 family peptidase